jgi:hypothetical protein
MPKMMVILRFFIYIILLCYGSSYMTQMSCKEADQDPWQIDITDHNEASIKLKNWIYAYMHDCNNPHRKIDHEPIPEIGIGSTIQYVTNQVLWCFSQNLIHRPTSQWSFADQDPKNCTLGMATIDCFLRPISPCGFEDKVDPNDDDPQRNLTIKEVLGNFSISHGDICTISRVMKKPIQWVHSHFVDYLMRPRKDMAIEINKSIDTIFKRRIENPQVSVIGVHYRDGNTYDFGRKVLNLTVFMEHVDKRAAELAARGRPVATVFFCSHVPQHNVKSPEYLASLFPRPWEYIVLPHVVVPHVVYKMELDDALNNQTIRAAAPLRQMFLEYLLDIEAMAQADVLIGVTSNMYTLVAAKRIVRNFHVGNDTCFIDSRLPESPLICEDNPQSHEIWKMYFGHLLSTRRNPDPGGGYETGSAFFDYRTGR